MKRRRIILLGTLFFSLTLVGISGFVIHFHRNYLNIPQDHLIGNTPRSLAALKEKGLPFSFLVIGDTQCNETVEVLVEKAVQEQDPSFMVFLGDFVKEPDVWNHRFFLTETAVEMKPPFPVFLVSANHDIYYPPGKGKNNREDIPIERRMTPEMYESLYGPRSFDFVFNDCLFIICSVNPRNRAGYLDELRRVLSQKGKNKRHIFVFVPYPPKGLAEYIPGTLSNEEAFFSLLQGYNDVTCFFGDFHGYWRGERNGVNLIVTGGGGRLKEFRLRRSRPNWGHFNHILKVSVDMNKVSEEIMTLPMSALIKIMDFEDEFGQMVFTKLFPLLQGYTWVLYGFFCLVSLSAIYSVVLLASSFTSHLPLKQTKKKPSPTFLRELAERKDYTEAAAVSVVVPVYNEQENVPILVPKLAAVLEGVGLPHEMIFVDDGSTDRSREILRGMAARYTTLRLLGLKNNRGLSAALLAGMREARNDVIVTLDSDLQNDPADIPRLLQHLDHYDMVTGWRQRRNDPWLKRMSSKIANATRNRVSGEAIHDSACTLRVFKKECVGTVPVFNGMHRFLSTLVKMEGYRVIEVPVSHHPRKYGKSKYNIRNRMVRSFVDLLAVRWMKHRRIEYEIEERYTNGLAQRNIFELREAIPDIQN